MRSYAEDSAAAGRHLMPDLTRAWALFGIAVVNVGVLAWPMSNSYHAEGGLLSGADYAAFFLVNALFLMKSYSLFSFMFGVGFAYQMTSAEKRGVGFAGRYWRRIIGLFAFGLLNIAAFFFGDILFIYAILGSILFLFRKSSAKTLIIWGCVIYGIQILLVALIALSVWAGTTFAPEEMAKAMVDMEAQNDAAIVAFTEGTFIQAALFRLTFYFQNIGFMIFFQGFGALAFFLFGLAAVRSGVISDPTARIWKRARWIGLPIGLLISGAGSWIMMDVEGMIDPAMMGGLFLIVLGSPFSTAGYAGLIAKFSEGAGGPLRTFFARGGTSSLTAYLMQNAILSFIFSAYGLGLFAKLPAATCIGIAAVVALFTIAFASLWRLYFRQGPTEAILRGWTYLGAR